MQWTKEYAYSLVGQPSSPLKDEPSRVSHNSSTRDDFSARTARLLAALVLVLLVSNTWTLVLYMRVTDGVEFISPHTGLSRRPTDRLQGYHHPVYMSHNETEADDAWSRVELGHGVVAVEKQWAIDRGLPPSREWKPNRDMMVYAVAAYHSIHCVPLVRRVLKKALRGDKVDEWEIPHAHHCLNIIREEIMCTADDTLLQSRIDDDGKVVPIGLNQTRQCRDWEAIRDWADAGKSQDKSKSKSKPSNDDKTKSKPSNPEKTPTANAKAKGAQSINVRHILCEKHARKEEAVAALSAGRKFDDVAREFSEDKARQGGLLGWKAKGSLLPEFERVAFELETSATSSPVWREVKTAEGYHLVMVEGRK
ncbi:MAG: hypothetical protein M1828_000778 [Chrysothrix sp. TS-e1954]|nr:MAG: hypothetical protein M1828_000778 [Chrysothrix sp. TS-e1954]